MTAVQTTQPRKPPSKRLMRVMNVVPRVLLRTPLHRAMSGSVLLLTFSGRRSGKRYTTPMSYVREGDEIFMSTEAPWWRNLEGGVEVAVRMRGKVLSGIAESVTDEDEVVEGLKTIVRLYPGYSRFIGVTVYEDGRPKEETVVRAARRGRILIRVRLDQGLDGQGR